MKVKWANDGILQANDGKMLVNDGEMLVNDGEMLINGGEIWSYSHFTIIDQVVLDGSIDGNVSHVHYNMYIYLMILTVLLANTAFRIASCIEVL